MSSLHDYTFGNMFTFLSYMILHNPFSVNKKKKKKIGILSAKPRKKVYKIIQE